MKNSTEDRFMSRVAFEPNTGCWIWNGRHPRDYGFFMMEGKKVAAHRAAWMLFCGEIPAGMFVCHSCDVPACVNPDHLFLGTAQDNADDMMQKGRTRRGERHQFAKLTEAQVREIKILLRSGSMKVTEAARLYKITHQTVSLMKAGKIWHHVQLTPEEIAEAEAQAANHAKAAVQQEPPRCSKPQNP